MDTAIYGIPACLLYLTSAGIQFTGLRRDLHNQHLWVGSLATGAIILHCLFSLNEIVTGQGINLSLLPMASVISLAISAILVASSLRRRVANLVIAIFPIAIITILATLATNNDYIPRQHLPGGILAHIILSVIAYGLLAIAALQAITLSFGDYELKHRKFGLLRHLPPLQTMESLLFELLWSGLSFLTLSIISGFVFLDNIRDPGLIHHTTITLAAWLVFATLLWGRHQLGWRGATASRWTISGFALLLLGYFGSKLVLEIILTSA
jgi:ABC-type uncharacterized transport system permease subunit